MANVNIAAEDIFLSHAERVREEIQYRFMRAHQILANREAELQEELQWLVDEYSGAGMREEIQQICDSRNALLATLRANQGRDTRSKPCTA